MNKGLLVIGTTPSEKSVGGVSIHVERMLQYLHKKRFPYHFFNYRSEPLLQVIPKIWNTSVVHLHICNPYYMFFLAFVCKLFGKKYIMTLHGKYVEGVQKPWQLIRFCVKMSLIPIVLNQESLDTCQKINKRTILIPAFIPPQKKESLELEIIQMVEKIHASGRLAVVTYGGKYVKDVNDQEVYGVDFLISFFKSNENYELVVSDPSGDYSRRYDDDITNIHFIDHPHSLFELIKRADLFVRNTSKDGDSLSVKEALYLRKPVLCTDVVARPKGVLLYKYSDMLSFKSCLSESKFKVCSDVESGEEKLLNMYQSLIKI